MLDAYIIDRIRREREQNQRRNSQLPLYIDTPRDDPEEEPADRRGREQEKPHRGSVVIDYRL